MASRNRCCAQAATLNVRPEKEARGGDSRRMRSNVIAASERGETTQPRSRGGQLRPVLVGVRVCHFDIEDNSSLQINQVIVRKGEGQMTVGQNTSVAAFDAFAAAQTTEAAARRDELIASVVPVPGPTRNWGRLSVAQLATVGAEGDTAFATDG